MSHPRDHIERRVVRAIFERLQDLRPELHHYIQDPRLLPLVLSRLDVDNLSGSVIRALEALHNLDELSRRAKDQRGRMRTMTSEPTTSDGSATDT